MDGKIADQRVLTPFPLVKESLTTVAGSSSVPADGDHFGGKPATVRGLVAWRRAGRHTRAMIKPEIEGVAVSYAAWKSEAPKFWGHRAFVVLLEIAGVLLLLAGMGQLLSVAQSEPAEFVTHQQVQLMALVAAWIQIGIAAMLLAFGGVLHILVEIARRVDVAARAAVEVDGGFVAAGQAQPTSEKKQRPARPELRSPGKEIEGMKPVKL